MNWQDIKVSEDNTHFILDGSPIFNKRFIEVLKFHAPGLAPVKDETGSYHIDIVGQPIYTHRYSRTFGFYCNRATVVDGNKWYHITNSGERTYTQDFVWAGNFQENLCTVRDAASNYFHIDLAGERIYDSVFIYCGDFKDGFASAKFHDNRYRHIDTKGDLLNTKSFLDLCVFHKNYATARDEHGWFHIDKHGEALYPQRYNQVEPFYNGFALVTTFTYQKVIIDESGQELLIV